MKSRIFTAICILTFSIAVAFAADTEKHSAKPKEGFVPDAKTATRVAVAVWEPIYGEEHIALSNISQKRHLDCRGYISRHWFGRRGDCRNCER